MSAPAGWYTTDDGVRRYWDGNQWSVPDGAGPAAAAVPGPPPVTAAASTPATPRSVPVTGWVGWAGLALTAVLGAAVSGISGAAVLSGLFVAVTGLVALARGRVGWARLRSRAAGGVALGVATALVLVGGATGAPQPAASPRVGPPTGPTTQAAASTSVSATTTAPTAGSTSTAPVTTTPAPGPAKGTALAAAMALPVKGRAAKTGYDRDLFGQAWFDADRNGCDTRNDILRRDLTGKTMSNRCKVRAGTLARDPYTGAAVRFVYGGPSEVDIDHVVALGDAWQKGAATWPAGKRLAFANDPVNLLAVTAGANRAKGAGDAATWLPPNKAYRCSYVARQVTVKRKYHLWVTPAERAAMVRVLSGCDTLRLPGPGPAPTTARLPRTHSAPQPAATPAPARPRTTPKAKPKPQPAGVYYRNCAAVRAAGAAPIHAGQPGYSRKLDRDGDGVACER